MEISQLQELISESRRLQNFIDFSLRAKEKEKLDIESYKKRIRQSRIEIMNLQYELKYDLKEKISRNDHQKTLKQLQKEVKNTEAINYKIFDQYKQLNELVTKTRKKIDRVQLEIKKAQQTLQLEQEFKRQFEQSEKFESAYWELRSKLQYQLLNQKEEQEHNSFLVREKQKQTHQISCRIKDIDQKYLQIDENVRVQKQIIDSILVNEKQNSDNEEKNEANHCAVKVFNENEEKQFNKIEDFNPFEKFELENILQKNEFQKKSEKLRMGKILHQKNSTVFFGKIINLRNRRNYNMTDISSFNHLKTEPNNQVKLKLSSSLRLEQLEKKKRIRTRETEMRRFSQHYKNFLQQSPQFSDETQKPKNILEVYEKVKANKSLRKKIAGNIEIIKLLKTYNKKKMPQRGKGISMECQQQYQY